METTSYGQPIENVTSILIPSLVFSVHALPLPTREKQNTIYIISLYELHRIQLHRQPDVKSV